MTRHAARRAVDDGAIASGQKVTNAPADLALPPARRAAAVTTVGELDLVVAQCRACPRLVAWRELIARERRSAFRTETYWGRAVPGFGPADAAVLIVGLAPA